MDSDGILAHLTVLTKGDTEVETAGNFGRRPISKALDKYREVLRALLVDAQLAVGVISAPGIQMSFFIDQRCGSLSNRDVLDYFIGPQLLWFKYRI